MDIAGQLSRIFSSSIKKKVSGVCQFQFLDATAAPQAAWVRLGGSEVQVQAGWHQRSDLTIRVNQEDLHQCFAGNLTLEELQRSGRMKIEGSLALQLYLRDLLYAFQHGLDAVDEYYYYLEDIDGFDRRFGTDTSQVVELYELDDVTESQLLENARYRPTTVQAAAQALRALAIDHSEFVFVDLGCGKGRTLLLASAYPFQKIVGVEFSPQLCRIAESNIRIFPASQQKCRDLSVVCADVREYQLPRQNTVFYLYESFKSSVLSAFLSRLQDSLKLDSRQVLIVSLGHSLAPQLKNTPWLKQEIKVKSPDTIKHWETTIYSAQRQSRE